MRLSKTIYLVMCRICRLCSLLRGMIIILGYKTLTKRKLKKVVTCRYRSMHRLEPLDLYMYMYIYIGMKQRGLGYTLDRTKK